MANYLQAPKLVHKGKKETSNTIYWQLPQDLMAYVFNNIDNRCGAQIKLMCLLLGTCGNGSFAVSEKFVTDTCGMSEQGYKSARKALVDKGWLTHDTKSHKIIVNLDYINQKIKEDRNNKNDEDNPIIPIENKNDGDKPINPIGDNPIIPIEDKPIIPKGINGLSYNKEDKENNREDNKELAATPHQERIGDLVSRGVDYEALAKAKTKQEQFKAMGF